MTEPAATDVAHLHTVADDLRAAFVAHRYDADGVLDLLGEDAHAALGRGEPVPVRRACAGGGELGTLTRLLLIGDTCDRSEVAAALGPLDLDTAEAVGLLRPDGDGVRAAVDVRPLDTGRGTRWLFSDLDGATRETTIAPDHVLGVGQASLSLLRASVTASGSVLDLGTGCGVQAVHALDTADHVVATDITARAAAMTRAGMAINGVRADRYDLRTGPWFAPVDGERFDHVVANPPFVVGTPTVTHSYRDSGLDLDGASALVVSTAADHLADGGTACLLASWVVTGGDWRERVAGWIPDHGVDAWVVQRDVADPALYVGTWLRDAGLDPRSGDGARRAQEWLEHLDRAGVEGVGFGFVFLRSTGEATDLLAEEMSHAISDPMGPEADAYLSRAAWLRTHDIDDARLQLAPDVALEQISTIGADGAGWSEVVCRLHRTDGPRWTHEIDSWGRSLVAGLSHDGLSVADVADLLAAATGESLDPAVLRGFVNDLVRHGILLPPG
ncbi:methyltransferase [Williamsia herbipolensis]|uniref:Methyltransferase n=1 Tax=Williamsia herbipolensis TaxID=1603258 RepID=A0AAU4K3D0_9NOCA|nr:methyltransferase [Williamsia herbipolensis]